MDNNLNNNQFLPEPTWVFIGEILFCISGLFSGSIGLYEAFRNLKGDEQFIPACIASLVFLIVGIFFIHRVIKQIKLRINWKKENNLEPKEIEITSNEANKFELENNIDVTYHNETIEKEFGTKNKIKIDKYGNKTLVTTTLNIDKKMPLGAILRLIAVIIFLIGFCFMGLGIIMQEIGRPLPEEVMKTGVNIFVYSFVAIWHVGIVTLIITIIKDFINKDKGDKI